MIIVCFVRTLRSKSLTGLGHHGDERPVLSAHPWMNARSGAGVLHCLVRSDARTVASGQGCANFHKKTDRQTGTQAHRHTGTQAHRQTDRQTDTKTNKHADTETKKHTRQRQTNCYGINWISVVNESELFEWKLMMNLKVQLAIN